MLDVSSFLLWFSLQPQVGRGANIVFFGGDGSNQLPSSPADGRANTHAIQLVFCFAECHVCAVVLAAVCVCRRADVVAALSHQPALSFCFGRGWLSSTILPPL